MPDQSTMDRILSANGYVPPPEIERDAPGPTMTRIVSASGDPRWVDPSIPAEQRFGNFLKVQALATPTEGGPDEQRVFGRTYNYNAEQERKREAEILEKAKRLFPGVDDAQIQQQFRLERAHVRQSGQKEDNIEFIARSVLPGNSIGNAARTYRYGDAVKRFNEGKASQDDIEVIARYERLQQIEGKESTGQSTFRAVAGVPGMIGEAYLGGGAIRGLGLAAKPGLAAAGARLGVQTAAMPSMYLERGAQNQLANPNENAFQSYAPAYGIGLVQTAILGSLSNRFSNVPTMGGRLAARTGLGMAEQQGADVALSAFDEKVKEVTGKTLGLDTRYGLAGSFIRGEDDAWKHAVVQTATFGAFASLHGLSPEKVLSAFKSAVDAGARRGRTRDAVAKDLVEAVQPVQEHIAESKVPDPEVLQKIVEATPEGPTRDYVDAMAEAYRSPDPEAFKKYLDEQHGPLETTESKNVAETHLSTDIEAKPESNASRATNLPSAEPISSKTDLPVDPAEIRPIVQQIGDRPAEAKNQPGDRRLVIGPPKPPPPRVVAPKRRLGEPVEPETGLKRTPEMEKPPVPVDPKAEFDAAATKAALDPFERHVLAERFKPEARSHDKIANDFEMRKPNNEKYTRQQVSNIEKRAREKMVAAGAELPGFTGEKSVAAEVHAQQQAEGELRAKRKAKLTAELASNPEGVARKSKKRADKLEQTEHKIDQLADQLLKEIERAERAGTELTQERRDFFAREADRLRAETETRRPRAKNQDADASPARPGSVGGEGKPDVKLLAARIGEAIRRLKIETYNFADVHVSQADAKELNRQFDALSPADQRAAAERIFGQKYLSSKKASGDVAFGLNALHNTLGAMESRIADVQAIKSKYDALNWTPESKSAEDAAADMLAAQAATMQSRPDVTGMKNQHATAPVGPDSPTIRERARQFVRKIIDGFRELGGAMFPATGRHSAELVDAEAHYISAPEYGRRLAPELIDKVFPDRVVDWGDGKTTKQKVSDEFMVLVGTVGQEMRFRHAREAVVKKAQAMLAEANAMKDPEKARLHRNEAYEWEKKAAQVKTLIGQPLEKGGFVDRNPLVNEGFYQDALRDPEVLAALERYKEHVVPILEANYRKAEGLDPDEAIDSLTQIPGMPINARAWRKGDDTSRGVVSFGGGRDLTVPKQQKLGFARQAKLNAEGYVLHFGDIIENSIARSTELAAKAEMYRVAADTVAKWGRGSPPEDGYQFKLKADPPKGTQLAGEGESFLWFKDKDVFADMFKALEPNPLPWKRLPLSGIFNRLTLASLGEVTAHSKNLLTTMFRPGMGPVNLIKNVRDVIRNTPEIRERIVELTRIGAMKPEGFEAHGHHTLGSNSQTLLGKVANLAGKPLKWTGKVLDVIDKAMRLTADQAFTRNSLRIGAKATEGQRRDFINQLGQYNRRAQNWTVQFLRDTGIGPFATAGTTYFINGLKALTLGHGMRGLGWKADAAMRAEMLFRMTTLLAAIPVINYFAWGRVDGDDNTPLGSVKIGKSESGKTQYMDLANLTGLTRGARETGLLAWAEGSREGAKNSGVTTADKVDAARRDIQHSIIHPFAGPTVATVYTALTGNNTLGSRISARPETDAQLKKLGKTPEDRQSETGANLTAAAIHANPIVGALLQLADMDPGHTRPTTTQEEMFRQMGPFGVKSRAQPPGAPHREMTIPNQSTEQHKATQQLKKLQPMLKK